MGLACGSDEPTAGTTAGASDASIGDSSTTSDPTGSTSDPSSRPTTSSGRPSNTAAGEVTGAPAPPGFLVVDDAGTYGLTVGGRTALRLGDELDEAVVDVMGDAVEVVRVAFESDPGYEQYDIVGRRPGEATVRVGTAGATHEFTFVVA